MDSAYLTTDDVARHFGLTGENVPKATVCQRVCALWRRTNERRSRSKLPPLSRLRIGREWRYAPDVLDAIADAHRSF